MKTMAIVAGALAMAALPAVALAGGSEQGTALDCGTVMVKPAKPKLGLPKAGAYDLNSFAKKAGVKPPSCANVKKWANAYVAKGTVPSGYRVKGYSNMIGRDFFKKGQGTSYGFQIIWTN